MMRPEGYRKTIRLMKLADKFNIPINDPHIDIIMNKFIRTNDDIKIAINDWCNDSSNNNNLRELFCDR